MFRHMLSEPPIVSADGPVRTMPVPVDFRRALCLDSSRDPGPYGGEFEAAAVLTGCSLYLPDNQRALGVSRSCLRSGRYCGIYR